MTAYTPSTSFHDAATYLSKSSSLAKVSNTIKLELYGLFKWVTVSPSPNTSRPSIFDMTGRAKWDAWDAAGKKYTNGSDAESRYLEIAHDLGWQPGAGNPAQSEEDEESIWDDDAPTTSSNNGSGMGVAVSVMSPPLDADESIHGLAIAGDLRKLDALFIEKADVDINSLDEYGYTPLHLACDRGNTDVVRLLLDKGADVTIKDPDEMTPAELAQIAGHHEIAEMLSNH